MANFASQKQLRQICRIKMTRSSLRYTESDRVRDLVEDNSKILLVLNRFRIPFGFGNKSVKEVCNQYGVDTDTFLAIANLVCGKIYQDFQADLKAIIDYLRETHAYILNFRLPDIRETLIQAVYQSQIDQVAVLIIKFFDEYIEEVRHHMEEEDKDVFPYVQRLIDGEPVGDFRIANYASGHESAVSKLDELKELFVQHYELPNTKMLSSTLFHIMECGDDLVSHCEIENKILFPAVQELEEEAKHRSLAKAESANVLASRTEDGEPLSQREIEVVRLVAHGLSNKEIADRLNLSFHTITTYRKNLSAKLNIHSTAAMTIFAILHGIVDPKEIELK